jgi:hypothetical protein
MPREERDSSIRANEPPATDDRVRRDGGKPVDEAKVLIEELVKAARNARRRNTRDEPGS